MKIEIGKCDLCQTEYRMDVPNNHREIGHIKLDMKGCYYVQMVYEKEVCANCAKVIAKVIYDTLTSLDKERQEKLNATKSN